MEAGGQPRAYAERGVLRPPINAVLGGIVGLWIYFLNLIDR